jgi:hypothetical protein
MVSVMISYSLAAFDHRFIKRGPCICALRVYADKNARKLAAFDTSSLLALYSFCPFSTFCPMFTVAPISSITFLRLTFRRLPFGFQLHFQLRFEFRCLAISSVPLSFADIDDSNPSVSQIAPLGLEPGASLRFTRSCGAV